MKADLPFSATAETINVVCGSGLDSINQATRMVQFRDADVVVAGGMESMSNAPYALKMARFGYCMGNANLIDTMVNHVLWDTSNDYHMGITAENIAEKWNITRTEVDDFSAASQQKACKAIDDAVFQEESAFHDAMMVVTSLPEESRAKEVFQIYQLRWQVELLFKRLKSIFGIGNIPNKRPERIQAWLARKIMVALLLEKKIGQLNCFP